VDGFSALGGTQVAIARRQRQAVVGPHRGQAGEDERLAVPPVAVEFQER
jgi:hypothetical protein